MIKKKFISRKMRKNHIKIHISCKNREKNEIVNEEIRKAIRKIKRITDNKVSFEITNDYYDSINLSSSGTASTDACK